MIFRAIFWIGLVSLLAPHEPDLGLGHPGAGTSNVSTATLKSTVESLWRSDKDCGNGCAGGLGFTDSLHLNVNRDVIRGLAKVKAEIAADQRARAEKIGSL